MNAILPILEDTRHKVTTDELAALVRAGFFEEPGRVELVDGLITEMASEGVEHGDLKNTLVAWLYRNAALSDFRIFVETTLYLDKHNTPEPDIHIFPAGIHMRDVKPDQVALVIEIADTSLRKDTEVKAPLYTRFGVREYWVIDLETRNILSYRPDGEGSYRPPQVCPSDAVLECGSIAGLALRLDDLKGQQR